VAAVAVLAAGLASWAGAAGPKGKIDFKAAPAVYGGDALFAFSGMEGETPWAMPVVGRTLTDGLGIRFELPKNPTIRIRLPEPGMSALTFQMVTGDTIVATVPWDTEPLIIAFVAPNVVAGRVPLSCRVGYEGGDANALMLRKDFEGRTTFSFCYETQPAAAAPPVPAPPAKGAAPRLVAPAYREPKVPLQEAANAGLGAAVESFMEARLDYYRHAEAAPVDSDRAQVRALAKAYSVLRVNECAPEADFKFHWTTLSRWPQREMSLWGSAFNSLGLMHVDPKLAKEALLAVYAFQAESGAIPAHMAPAAAAATADVSQPPILAWAAWQVYLYDQARDKVFLEKAFDASQKHVTWFLKKRRVDGEAPPNKSLESGTPLFFWQSAEEAGVEASPRFDGGGTFAAVDLSCYLASECWSLQAMAQRLGYGELAKTWGTRAEAIAAAARAELWDEERGFFFDRKAAGGERLGTWSAAGLLPLWSGVATPEQAARLKGHLLSKKFWTPLPLPVVAHDDPGFKMNLWRGATFVNMNYLVMRGLQKYGYAREAADLRDKTLAAVAGWYGKTGCLWEYYDGDEEQSPRDLPRSGAAGGPITSIADCNWTAALYIDMMLRIKP
jgi:hypothetical protein